MIESGKAVVLALTFRVPPGENPQEFIQMVTQQVTVSAALMQYAKGAAANVIDDTQSRLQVL